MPRIRSIAAAGAAATALALTFLPAAGAAADESSQSQIQRGFEINPVPLDLNGKNRGLVGLGSYIVNTTGCNDCHTNPSYAPGGNPFLGQPEEGVTPGRVRRIRVAIVRARG